MDIRPSGRENPFVAAGCMKGLSQSGGIGLAVARWIVEGGPGMDVFAMDLSRYGHFAKKAYVLTKTRENLSWAHAVWSGAEIR